ncbi:LuxR C-terminal-related transcriptional regulator [Arthrobacter sp. NPDC092385]|uniref:helix-turn-helix transcriptional regulator n=1 Tax=Arthrobacter sp. NPDC092385 TaxID=3363943 RepID=UPI003809018F
MESQTHGFISTRTPLSGGASVAAGGEQAFLEARAHLVDDVHQRILAPGRVGAVLLGGEGSGKTAILRVVAHRVSRTHHVVRIWASKNASAEPYRAIASLLAELETEQARHPLTLLQGIRTLLAEQSDGRPVVFAIDNAEYLDPESATIITRLVSGGGASVLIAAESLRTVNESFSDLWRNGELERFDLPSLTRTEIRGIAEAALGAPLSPQAVEAAWRSSEGNARFLCAALEELPQSGLILHRGAWVVAGPTAAVAGSPRVPAPVRDRARSALGALHARELRIVRALAFAGALPAAVVRRLASLPGGPSDAPVPEPARAATEAAHLDALQPLTVQNRGEGATTVSLASRLFAAAVREQTTAAEASELYLLLSGGPVGAFDPAGLDPMLHAEWLLAAGLPVPADLSLAAARRCTFAGLADRALFWASRESDDSPERLLEAARAALAAGRGEEAGAFSARGRAASAGASTATAVSLLILASRAARLVGEVPAQRQALLEEADERLVSAGREPGSTCMTGQQILEHRGELTIARAEEASFSGNYQVAADMLQGADRAGWTPEQAVLGTGLLCVALAVTDGQHAAVGLADSLQSEIAREPSFSRRTLDITRLRIAAVRYAAGHAGEPVPGPGVEGRARPSSAAADIILDSARGVASALQGRPDQARALLFPVARQLELQDPYSLLPLVAAALAYSSAEAGALGAAIGYLPLAQAGHAVPRAAHAFINQIQVCSAGLRESQVETAAKLGHLAEAARGEGAWWLEMSHRLAQVRAGDSRAATALAGAAARVEGIYAASCELYAKATSTGDVELFAQAMENAELAGDSRFARECAAQALQAAQLSGTRGVLKGIQQRARLLFGDTADLELGAALERLTKREREVARLAAQGESNRSIAVQMGVTVRTVEGHLYQVYSKLHIRARNELADLILAGAR